MNRFKLGPYDPQYRYEEHKILYTANANVFDLKQVEDAFDKDLFIPLITYKDHKPVFTKDNKPV